MAVSRKNCLENEKHLQISLYKNITTNEEFSFVDNDALAGQHILI